MTPSLCALMAEYNRWMNARLYEAAGKLPAHELTRDRGAFFGSLFGTLNHIAVADLLWLHRFTGIDGLSALAQEMRQLPRPKTLTEPLAGSLPELAALRHRIDETIVGLAGTLSAQHLAQTLRYSSTEGVAQAKNVGRLLQHFFNHQTHHRGQASTLLFQAGIDVGVTDLNALIPSEAPSPDSADRADHPMSLSAARIFVRDLAAAHRFYGQVLGLRLQAGAPDAGFCVYAAGSCQLVVEPVAADAPPEDQALVGRFTGLSFAVTDIAHQHRTLSLEGVVFTGAPERQAWGGWLATLLDPEGNALQLVQYPNAA